jgi:hypothetical protein
VNIPVPLVIVLAVWALFGLFLVLHSATRR